MGLRGDARARSTRGAKRAVEFISNFSRENSQIPRGFRCGTEVTRDDNLCIIHRGGVMSGEAVKSEQIRTLYRQGVPVMAANLIIGGLVSASLWTLAPQRLTDLDGAGRGADAGADRAAAPLLAAPSGRRRVGTLGHGVRRRFCAGRRAVGAGLLSVLRRRNGADRAAAGDVRRRRNVRGAAGTLKCYIPAFRSYVYPRWGCWSRGRS